METKNIVERGRLSTTLMAVWPSPTTSALVRRALLQRSGTVASERKTVESAFFRYAFFKMLDSLRCAAFVNDLLAEAEHLNDDTLHHGRQSVSMHLRCRMVRRVRRRTDLQYCERDWYGCIGFYLVRSGLHEDLNVLILL